MKRLRVLIYSSLILAVVRGCKVDAQQNPNNKLTKEKAAEISLNTTCTSLYRKSGQALCSDIPLAKKGLSYIHDIIPLDSILRRNLRAEIERFLGMEVSYGTQPTKKTGPHIDIIDDHAKKPSTGQTKGGTGDGQSTCPWLEVSLRNAKQQLTQQQQLSQMCANSSNALKSALYSFLGAEKDLFKAHDAYITLLNHSLAYEKEQSDTIVNDLKQAWEKLKEAIDELDVAFVAAGMGDARFNIDEHYPDIKASLFILEQKPA